MFAGQELDHAFHGIDGLRFYAIVKEYFTLSHNLSPSVYSTL